MDGPIEDLFDKSEHMLRDSRTAWAYTYRVFLLALKSERFVLEGSTATGHCGGNGGRVEDHANRRPD